MVRRRSLNPNLPGGPPFGSVIEGTSVWSDYDGDTVYGDYVANFDANNQFTGVTNTMAYLPGIGEQCIAPGGGPPNTPCGTGFQPVIYYHGDQIGSLRVATDGSGNVVGRFVYSAFGEPILAEGATPGSSPPCTRYRYGGAWQYETGLGRDENGADPLPFLRIGHRWYDPETGRFMQRDPIGINGGLNIYAYCHNRPTISIDPYGLWTIGFEIEINLSALIGIKIQVSAHIGYSDKKGLSAGGNFGVGGTYGPQVGASASWSCIGSNAQSVADLGNGIAGEIDVNAGPFGGIEVGVGHNEDGTSWTSVGVSPPFVGGIGGLYGAGGGAVYGISISGSPRPPNRQRDPTYWPG